MVGCVGRLLVARFDSADSQPLNYNAHVIGRRVDGIYLQGPPLRDVGFPHHQPALLSTASLGAAPGYLFDERDDAKRKPGR
ncbi:MAG: hypothetical protein M3282_06330 [Gemmatimonadota bacterium]|nr:hypothetical protein [Gemmatimonadota bacterium]